MKNLHQPPSHVNSPAPDLKTSDRAVRDDRRQNYFWADNRFMDEVAPIVGGQAVAIYMLLCRLANADTQMAWPSSDYIGQQLKMSTPTVIKHIASLEACGVIEVIARKSESGSALSNAFRLIDMTEWDLERGKNILDRGKEILPHPQESLDRGKRGGKKTLEEQYKDRTTTTASGPDEAPEPPLDVISETLAAAGLDAEFVKKLKRYESGARFAFQFLKTKPRHLHGQTAASRSKLIWDIVAHPENYELKSVAPTANAPAVDLSVLPEELREYADGLTTETAQQVAARWAQLEEEQREIVLLRLGTNESLWAAIN